MRTYLQKMIFSFIILLLFPNQISAQSVSWAKNVEIGMGNESQSVADDSGNIIITGIFSTPVITFGTTTLSNNGFRNIFIVKYDPTGNVIWAKSAGGSSNDFGQSIAVDPSGNTFLTGFFSSPTITFGTTTLSNSNNGYTDIFLVKYDPAGNVVWVKSAGGSSFDGGGSVAVDSSGNTFLTGYFNSPSITFGTTTLFNNGESDIFIVKYDPSGNVVWAKNAGGSNGEEGPSVAVDKSGNPFLTGYFSSPTITFGTTTLSNSNIGYTDIFLVKYDPAGNVVWAKSAGGSNIDEGQSVAVDLSGNTFLTGYFRSPTITFGTTTLSNSNNGSSDIFIVKYDPTGNVVWAKSAGGSGNDHGQSVAVDQTGNTFLIGNFEAPTISFGTTTLTNNGFLDIFIVKYDPTGNVVWAKSSGEYDNDYGYSVAVDQSGNTFLTGSFNSSTITFGATTLTKIGSGYNIYIVKYYPENLTISSPKGSETWQTNTPHNITWNTNGDGNLKIEISTNNGTNWLTLQNSVSASLGNFTLVIPPFSNSNQCKIKLTNTLIPSITATSDVFSITSNSVPNLTITSPNTSVVWKSDLTKEITWNFSGSVGNVKLEYTTNNGYSWNLIASNIPATNRSYQWLIPTLDSKFCRVRISEISNPILNDVSDNLFTIINLKIVSPAGGEYWESGPNNYITWSPIDTTSYYLYYSTNNGNLWNFIAYMARNGSFEWYIPSISSNTCKIKIVSMADTSLYAISNQFLIWHPIVSTHSLTIGQDSQYFDETNFTLSAFIFVSDTVTTSYIPYRASSIGSLPVGVNSVSSYYWKVESPSLSFFNGIAEVPISVLQGVINPANLVWLYRPASGNAWQNIGGTIVDGKLQNTTTFDGLGEFAIGTTGFDPLPVDLATFTTTCNKNSVTIKWETKTEINSVGFELQKNENSGWKTIANIPGSGNSNSTKSYTYVDHKLNKGIYQYRLKMIDTDGSFKYSQIINVEIGVPKEFSLMQNYPNPFNPSTIIEYEVPYLTHVNIDVYNITGQLVKKLISEKQDAGYYTINFNPVGLSTGIYFYILRAGNTVITRKMVYLK